MLKPRGPVAIRVRSIVPHPPYTLSGWAKRVLQMSVREMYIRSSQEASKWLECNDRLRPWIISQRESPGNEVSASLSLFPGRHFFEGAANADALTSHLLGAFPQSCQDIISTANAICRRRFDLLGYRELDFGDPPDWHLDPVSGRRASLVHWSRIDPLDQTVVGDSKVIWELNRHQWLLHLGQAYRFTGDGRYADEMGHLIRDWMRANPAGMGINWASSLEVAFRLISWCWALVLFDGSPALSIGLIAEILGGIDTHARHIERYLSHYFSPNTHLTGEALGLFYAGTLFPSLRRARRWKSLGRRILVAQCRRQIVDDGVYFEQSTCYQRYTAEIYLHFLILAKRNGIEVPDYVSDRLVSLLDFLAAIRRPDGSLPQIGDADGGWLLPLVPRAAGDLRGIFSVARAFFSRPDHAWAAGGTAPEALWLLGPRSASAAQTLTPCEPRASASRLFAKGGYAVMQTAGQQDAHQLVLDVGPLGCPISAAHGHADLLSVQCSVFGEPYIIDPGTYRYAPDAEWRDYFRSTMAHSTIRVDEQDQALPAGRFRWQARPRAKLRQWVSTDVSDFIDAEHDAYAGLPDPVIHRRRVLFVKPRYWVIADDLDGAAEHHIELRLQFAPMPVILDSNFWARANGSGGHGLFVRTFAPVPMEAEIRCGERRSRQGWVSFDYGQRRPAPVLIYRVVTRLPLRLATILFPAEDQRAPLPEVRMLGDARRGLLGLAFGDGQECVQIDERRISTLRHEVRLHRRRLEASGRGNRMRMLEDR